MLDYSIIELESASLFLLLLRCRVIFFSSMLLSNIEWAAGEMKEKHENFHIRFPDAVIYGGSSIVVSA